MVAPTIFAVTALATGLWILWRERWNVRLASVLLYALLICAIGGMALSCLGVAKPLRLEWSKPEHAVVLAFVLDEPRAIYLWLSINGQPRAFSLPWDKPTAIGLNNAAKAAKRDGVPVMADLPPGYDGTPGKKEAPRFYPAPQPAVPPKAGED